MLPGSVLVALLRRPRLWAEAVRTWLALVPRGWWRRPPFLPRPRPEYLQWRLVTAYGSSAAPLRVEDVVEFLEWRRSLRGW